MNERGTTRTGQETANAIGTDLGRVGGGTPGSHQAGRARAEQPTTDGAPGAEEAETGIGRGEGEIRGSQEGRVEGGPSTRGMDQGPGRQTISSELTILSVRRYSSKLLAQVKESNDTRESDFSVLSC